MFVMILRGIPGSGKSTHARYFHELVPGSVIVSADQYMRAGDQPFEWSRLERCHNQCRTDFLQALNDKAPLVIVDNTNSKFADLVWYVSMSESHGYKFGIYQFHVEPEVAFKRQIHGVPLETLELMATRIWHERMPAGWTVFDNGRPWRPSGTKQAADPKAQPEVIIRK